LGRSPHVGNDITVASAVQPCPRLQTDPLPARLPCACYRRHEREHHEAARARASLFPAPSHTPPPLLATVAHRRPTRAPPRRTGLEVRLIAIPGTALASRVRGSATSSPS